MNSRVFRNLFESILQYAGFVATGDSYIARPDGDIAQIIRLANSRGTSRYTFFSGIFVPGIGDRYVPESAEGLPQPGLSAWHLNLNTITVMTQSAFAAFSEALRLDVEISDELRSSIIINSLESDILPCFRLCMDRQQVLSYVRSTVALANEKNIWLTVRSTRKWAGMTDYEFLPPRL